MRQLILTFALLAFAGVASAQDIDVNSTSNSGAVADSSSVSSAGANSNQGQLQGQGQEANNANVQATQLTFEGTQIPTTTTAKVKTNAAVPLAASVSFSSDYCGGTVSAGASGFGLSLGASAPKMDGNCQSLRRAEKFGVAAANAHSAGLTDLAAKLIAMQVWEICHAGVNPKQSGTLDACGSIALVDGDMPAVSQPPMVAPPVQQSAPPPVQYNQPRNPRGEVSPAPRAIVRGSDGRSAEVGAASR